MPKGRMPKEALLKIQDMDRESLMRALYTEDVNGSLDKLAKKLGCSLATVHRYFTEYFTSADRRQSHRLWVEQCKEVLKELMMNPSTQAKIRMVCAQTVLNNNKPIWLEDSGADREPSVLIVPCQDEETFRALVRDHEKRRAVDLEEQPVEVEAAG